MKDAPKNNWPWFHLMIEAALLITCCGLAFALHRDRNTDNQLLDPLRSLWMLMNEPTKSGNISETGEILCRIDGVTVAIKMRRVEPPGALPAAAPPLEIPATPPPSTPPSSDAAPAPTSAPPTQPTAP
jgi:hypothetical protein